ncbi:MAG: excinuclease ABC subunit UvrA [Armatimonadetes bacterium CG_4_8_14_3_um_filter_58_9]|nr:MAG: excinuclease ABC subunit UvrA [Armatimonadetes bacterium CG_4_8_14_3_um_filter_58_9]
MPKVPLKKKKSTRPRLVISSADEVTSSRDNQIVVRGAREHNLKSIDIDLPRDKLIVITGISGSGKSSLAFDTLYAEGQRRYVESLSAYARQFLGQMDKPDVDFIGGLSPAVSIDQKSTSHNPRSTVATVTEIYDYLRLLFARIGIPHCPQCGRVISRQSVELIVDQVMELPAGTRLHILAPVIRGRKGEFRQLFARISKEGFVRVRVDGEVRDVSEDLDLDRYKQHWIDVVVDRAIVKPEAMGRLADSVQTALKMGEGIITIEQLDGEETTYSEHFACVNCGISLEEIEPRMFSFNSPYGACKDCNGLGTKDEFDPDLVIPDRNLSLANGGLAPWRRSQSDYKKQILKAVAKHMGFDVHTPIRKLTPEQVSAVLYGVEDPLPVTYTNFHGEVKSYDAGFDGIIGDLGRGYDEYGDDYREELRKYMSTHPCPTCKGARLRPESLAVTVSGHSVDTVARMSVTESLAFFDNLSLTDREQTISRQVLKEIRERLRFLNNVGLDYLTLNRSVSTLAGGEAQRIRLATQIGSKLVGVLYILDEPSIGLHQRDNRRLLQTLHELRDLGNTVIVIEHDEETIREADHVVDIGPGAGERGGEVVVSGDLAALMNTKESITGQYLSRRLQIRIPEKRRKPSAQQLVIKGAREHNLKNINVKIPLGVFVCVTGVSGSGKSTLINDILYRRLANYIHGSSVLWGDHDDIKGKETVDKVIDIDQSPIGRTPRSNPATYTGTFAPIRDLFTSTREARARGYKPGRFSFNVKGGRCEACQGDGIIKIEMHFLPDVYVPCEVCKGKRYNRETLEVKYKGKSISEVLEMTVTEALGFFDAIPQVKRRLQTVSDVGLGYIKLGQPATTLSGGEAQRVKLATELSKRDTGHTLYVLDEPTTGLHFADIQRLLDVLHRLTDNGNTVIVIEHNLDVIKTADHIIDLGPEGGDRGGEVIAEGTPEEVAAAPGSYTGEFLQEALQRN